MSWRIGDVMIHQDGHGDRSAHRVRRWQDWSFQVSRTTAKNTPGVASCDLLLSGDRLHDEGKVLKQMAGLLIRCRCLLKWIEWFLGNKLKRDRQHLYLIIAHHRLRVDPERELAGLP